MFLVSICDNRNESQLFFTFLSVFTVSVVRACNRKFDVGFILDSSASVSRDYQKEKDFIKAMAASFQFHDDGPIAGVITFSTDAEISIKLSDHSMHNTNSFNKAVDQIDFMGKQTRIDKALLLAKNELFTKANGGRDGIPKVLIMLVDGSQTQDTGSQNPITIADELRDDDVAVYVVGIGPEVSDGEILLMAGNEPRNVFRANTFDILADKNFTDRVLNRICPGMFFKNAATIFKDAPDMV